MIWVIKSIIIRSAGHAACMADRTGADRVLVGRPDRKRPLGRPGHRWGNIKVDLQDMRWGGMGWIAVAQDKERGRALMNAVKKFQVP
jgi:hypothetical protein